jgi:hypothetical protein
MTVHRPSPRSSDSKPLAAIWNAPTPTPEPPPSEVEGTWFLPVVALVALIYALMILL